MKKISHETANVILAICGLVVVGIGMLGRRAIDAIVEKPPEPYNPAFPNRRRS